MGRRRAALGLVGQEPGQLDREARLASAPGADDREQPWLPLEPERRSVEELPLAPEEAGGGDGEVYGTRRPDGWKLAHAELEEVRRSVEILKPVAAEITQRTAVDECGRRCGEDHLTAVGERSDPCSPMDVDPDVPLRRNARSARVQAHAHSDRPRRERILARGRRRNSA